MLLGGLALKELVAGAPGLCAELTEVNWNSLVESNQPLPVSSSTWGCGAREGEQVVTKK